MNWLGPSMHPVACCGHCTQNPMCSASIDQATPQVWLLLGVPMDTSPIS